MQNKDGRSGAIAPSGHSAEPEPASAVSSAVAASTPNAACDCIEKVNELLKPKGQCVNATMLVEPRRFLMPLLRTDKWEIDKRRSLPTHMIAAFCPICGVKYPQTDARVL